MPLIFIEGAKHAMSALVHALLLLSLISLAACQLLMPSEVTDRSVAENARARQNSQNSVNLPQQRLIADILYEAKLAIADKRLMTPEDDNAFDRYQRVLSIDPNNKVALQGFSEIVARYLMLANQALVQGQYNKAQRLIVRAEIVDATDSAIASVWQELRAAKKSKFIYYALTPQDLSAKSLAIKRELQGIGQYAKQKKATFLIIARNDSEGRWIYQQVKQAAKGFRLRGNIELGASPGVRLRF